MFRPFALTPLPGQGLTGTAAEVSGSGRHFQEIHVKGFHAEVFIYASIGLMLIVTFAGSL